jgi:hypothetical protein
MDERDSGMLRGTRVAGDAAKRWVGVAELRTCIWNAFDRAVGRWEEVYGENPAEVKSASRHGIFENALCLLVRE